MKLRTMVGGVAVVLLGLSVAADHTPPAVRRVGGEMLDWDSLAPIRAPFERCVGKAVPKHDVWRLAALNTDPLTIGQSNVYDGWVWINPELGQHEVPVLLHEFFHMTFADGDVYHRHPTWAKAVACGAYL